MAHKRKLIRNAAEAALIAENITGVGIKVYANRQTSAWEGELPAIFVYTTEESGTARDLSSRTSIRKLTLKIRIVAQANNTVDDTLDDIAEAVETTFRTNYTITGTAQSAVYQSTEITLDPDAQTEVGVAELTYEIQFIQ